MGSRTAISAGVLAMALAAIPVAGAPAVAADDCPRGGGLLSGVTDGVCDTVDKVTGTVDTLTGDTVKPLTKGLGDTTGEVLGRVGEALPTSRPSGSRSSEPVPSRSGSVPEALRDACPPAVACDDQSVTTGLATPTPEPTTTGTRSAKPAVTPGAEPSGHARRDTGTATRRTAAPRHPLTTATRRSDATRQPVTGQPKADTDEPRIDLLWPNPFARRLTAPMRDQRVVRPSRPASDALGTSLTILLLASAVLATRIVQQRRQRTEQQDSIPFEPARPGGSRHRLA